MAKKTEKLVRWAYNENITAEEFILRLAPLVCDAMRSARELDGDMWVSDYRNLCEASDRLQRASEAIREGEAA